MDEYISGKLDLSDDSCASGLGEGENSNKYDVNSDYESDDNP
jgi:hypothetical protein